MLAAVSVILDEVVNCKWSSAKCARTAADETIARLFQNC